MGGVTHQQPEDRQPVFLGQVSKGLDSFFFFRVSMVVEIKKPHKRATNFCIQPCSNRHVPIIPPSFFRMTTVPERGRPPPGHALIAVGLAGSLRSRGVSPGC